MKPFTILYNLVKLPLVIAKDAAATPMDMMQNCTYSLPDTEAHLVYVGT